MKSFDTPNLPAAHRFAVHTILSKPYTDSSHTFQALALAASVSDGQLLWSQARKKTLAYQSIFLGISFIFTLLAAYIYHSKIYIVFPIFDFSTVSTKLFLVTFTLSFAIWSAWLGVKIQAFKEQLAAMQTSAKSRLAKYNKSSLSNNKGWSLHLLHEAEELIEKAVKDAEREELRLKNLKLKRNQRFMQRAFLLEVLEKQLEEILNLYKEQVKTILN